jgi:16S rRNA (cytosine1402-N4)-methyltransferase
MTGALHIPVLRDEVVAALALRPGALPVPIIVDATFGAGGYSRALLDAGAIVHGFDRDPDAISAGRSWPETRAFRLGWCCMRGGSRTWRWHSLK